MDKNSNHELLRIQELRSFGILDTEREEDFDLFTRLAARLTQSPISFITLVDEDRLFFKSAHGMDAVEAKRCSDSFCHVLCESSEFMQVPDALLDKRFDKNALVVDAKIRFYAGIPLLSNGYVIGSLCVLDYVARQLSERQIEALQTLAAQVMVHLELRRLHQHSPSTESSPDYAVEALYKSTHSERANKMLISCNQAMVRAEDEESLLTTICRIIVETGGYRMAWVGYARDGRYKPIDMIASYGKGWEFIKELHLSWSEDLPSGQGVGGRTIRSGEPVLVSDVTLDPSYPLMEQARKFGYRGVVCLPLRHDGCTFGMVSMASNEAFNMPAAELELLQQMADNLALGITNIRVQKEQRRIRLAMEKVAQLPSASEGNEVFQKLALIVAEACEADGAFVTRFLPGDPPTVARTLGAAIDGKLVGDFDYSLDGTPCEQLQGGGTYYVNVSVVERFPRAKLLADFGAQAYIGVIIRNAAAEPVGTIATLYRQPVHGSESMVESLRVFATRAAAEIAQQAAEAEIQHLAFYDSLTDLPNRKLFYDRLERALSSCTRTRKKGAVLFIDLDDFKTLNDTQGHGMGDMLLKQVAQRLGLCVRDSDTVARLGGDEFVMALTCLDERAEKAVAFAQAVAEKILASFVQPFYLAKQVYRCTPSIGITMFDNAGVTVDELLKQADMAMYKAKSLGRNKICFFSPEMQAANVSRAETESGLWAALDGQQFVLHYQPQLGDDGRVVGAEALLRWEHPVCGQILPASFIHLAEEVGLISDIGRWVLQAACTKLAEWAKYPSLAHLTLSVNVSSSEFLQPEFVQNVLAILKTSGANPRRLRMELTENVLVDRLDETIARMSALQAEGVTFSLDDFGTGYSSLAYLKSLPLSQIKIDRIFVKDLQNNPNNLAIIRSIVALAYGLGLQVMAEGVENKAQCEYLKRYSCHSYQGYFLSQPLPEEEFEAFMLKDSQALSS